MVLSVTGVRRRVKCRLREDSLGSARYGPDNNNFAVAKADGAALYDLSPTTLQPLLVRMASYSEPLAGCARQLIIAAMTRK